MEHARNVVVQLGSLIALYVSLSSFVALVFGIINILLPDTLDTFSYMRYESAADSIRFSIAFLIVFFPAYLVLTRLSHQYIRLGGEGLSSKLVTWLIYLSLLVGGGVLLGDLVALILSFLNGELTLRFVLKALVLFTVVGSAFAYYFLEVRGYWYTHEQQSKMLGALAAAVAVAVIIFGFFSINPPEEQRALLFDQERIDDLSEIQSNIGEYFRVKEMLPEKLEDLEVIGFGYEIPVDPETEEPYMYTWTSRNSFQLCATFSTHSTETEQFVKPRGYGFSGSWEHGAGEVCFSRTIDPDFFKPVR